MSDRIEEATKHHAPIHDGIVGAHQDVRITIRIAMRALDELVPPGREKQLSMTKLEEAMFWANAGIARAQRVGEEG